MRAVLLEHQGQAFTERKTRHSRAARESSRSSSGSGAIGVAFFACLRADRKYRKELLREGVECLLAGDLDTGKAVLRDYINATIGFEELSRRTKRPAKSLMRMLGPGGNPHARNLLEVIHHIQTAGGLRFELSLRAAS